jgi:hypothetical protein
VGVSRTRPRVRWADDGGFTDSVEQLFGVVFLLIIIFFFMQVMVWWHARNILEQASAEGPRAAAAADGSCADAPGQASAIATRIGGSWVHTLQVSCSTTAGIVTVRVSAKTPGFLWPGDLSVAAVATAPLEAP